MPKCSKACLVTEYFVGLEIAKLGIWCVKGEFHEHFCQSTWLSVQSAPISQHRMFRDKMRQPLYRMSNICRSSQGDSHRRSQISRPTDLYLAVKRVLAPRLPRYDATNIMTRIVLYSTISRALHVIYQASFTQRIQTTV